MQIRNEKYKSKYKNKKLIDTALDCNIFLNLLFYNMCTANRHAHKNNQ